MAPREPKKDPYAVANQVGAMLTSSLVLEEVLPAVARGITEALDVWECDLYEYSPEQRTMTCAACYAQESTPDDEAWVGTVVDVAGRPTYQAVIDRREVVEDHIDDEALDATDRALMERWGELASLAAPLVFNDEVIGCVTLLEKRFVRRFSDEDKKLLAALTVPAAVAIHNARMFRRQEDRNRQLSSLLDSSRAITSTVVLEEVLALVAAKAAAALESDECVIYEYDRDDDALVFRSVYERTPGESHDVVGERYALADYPEDRVLMRDGVIVEERLSDRTVPEATRRDMESWGEKTCLNVPLVFGGQAMGILVLIEKQRERHYTSDEVELARALGEQAAAAIQNAKLYAREEARSRRLVGLLDASQAMAASRSLKTVLGQVSGDVAALLAHRDVDVDVRLLNDDGVFLRFTEVLGQEDDLVADGDLAQEDTEDDGDTVSGRAAMSDDEASAAAPEDASSAASQPDPIAERALAASSPTQGDAGDGRVRLVVPLAIKDTVKGYVVVTSRRPQAFRDDEVELVQILANQAAVAIENARLYRAIHRQAITDGLTGLYNHRHFYDRLKQETARSQRYGGPLSLLMLDLDDFKLFNDAHGHPEGDAALRAIAWALLSQVRQNVDIVARYGGEEFAVLLPSTGIEGAATLGERLRTAVAQLSSTAGDGDGRGRGDGCDTREGVPLALTVSVGVATYPEHANDGEELVRASDKALYLAKRRGKNRVETFN